MSTFRRYSSRELIRIEQKLQRDLDAGKPSQYEVIVDNLKVISRTDDIEPFRELDDYVDPETTYEIAIRIFSGNSQRNVPICLFIPENRPLEVPGAGLSGLDNRLEERLAQERLKWEHEQLRRDHDKLERACEDKDRKIEKLEDEIAEYQKRPGFFDGFNIKDAIGTVGALAGGGANQNGPYLNGAETYEDDYQLLDEDEQTIVQLNEHDRSDLALVRALKEKFSHEQRDDFTDIVTLLSQQPELIKTTLEHLQHFQSQPQNL